MAFLFPLLLQSERVHFSKFINFSEKNSVQTKLPIHWGSVKFIQLVAPNPIHLRTFTLFYY